MKSVLVIFFILISCIAFSQEIREIKVISSKNIPVKCGVYFNGEHIGHSKEGKIILPKDCNFSDKIDIRPIDTEKYDGISDMNCFMVTDPIIIYTHQELSNAFKNAFWINFMSEEYFASLNDGEKKDIFSKAALASNEVYNIRSLPDSVRDFARIQTIQLTALAFGINDPFHVNGSYPVANQALINEVLNFQALNGIERTGKIDGKTLQTLSQRKSFSVFGESFIEAELDDSNWLEAINNPDLQHFQGFGSIVPR